MKNKVKKVLVCVSLSLLVLSGIPNYVHANLNAMSNNTNEIVTYAEEVKFYYRMVNGREQKRLWSRTYGYWLTAWIWV